MHVLYLIDFGLSISYISNEGIHKPMLVNQSLLRGNPMFASKNVFSGLSLSRRDDIISLLYMITYMLDPGINTIDDS